MKHTTILSCATALMLAACATSQTDANRAAASTAKVQVAEPQVQRQAIAPHLYQIAYSARQNAVFVASAGGREPDAPPPRIFRLDPQTLAVQAEIVLERHGLGLKLDDEADRLYIGNPFAAAITVLDTRSNQVVDHVQVAEKIRAKDFEGKEVERYPHSLRELVVDSAHHRLFAPGLWFSDGVLYVIDTRKLEVERVIPGFGFGAAGATLDAANGKLYVGNMQGQLFTVDTRTLALEKVQEVAADQLLNLAFDARKGQVLAVDHGGANPNMVREKFAKMDYTLRGEGNRVVAIDPASGEIVASTSTGEMPVTLLEDAARHRLFVTNRGSGTVTVYDSRDYRLLHTVELPTHPNSLALNPATGEVYVTIKQPLGESVPEGADESVARIVLPH